MLISTSAPDDAHPFSRWLGQPGVYRQEHRPAPGLPADDADSLLIAQESRRSRVADALRRTPSTACGLHLADGLGNIDPALGHTEVKPLHHAPLHGRALEPRVGLEGGVANGSPPFFFGRLRGARTRGSAELAFEQILVITGA